MIRVMTWNLWWRFGPWELRHAAIRSVIEREAPDVVCLQEVWSERGGESQAALLGRELGYFHAITDDPFEGRRSGDRPIGFHNAVLSRWPIQCDPATDSVPLPGEWPNAETGAMDDVDHGFRRMLWVTTASPWGQWPVISTHLDYRFDQSAVRQRQVMALLALIAERRGDADSALPVIVGADCNAVPDSDEIRLATGRSFSGLRNLVLSDLWEQRGVGPGHTWLADHPYQPHSAWPNRRVDYLFVSWPRPKPVGNPAAVWLAGQDAVDGVIPSDHLAVVADLVTERAAAVGMSTE